jgi:hypothetical protein
MPVGRENERNPLGHSGQRRLQDVVGSMLNANGSPHCSGFLVRRAYQNDAYTLPAFHNREGESVRTTDHARMW